MNRASKTFGAAQTLLLCVYTAIFFFLPGRLLLDPMPKPGIVLCTVGLLIVLVAFLSLRAVIQIEPEPKPEGHLVSSGIYKYIRHPIYTGMVIVVCGLFLRRPALFITIASVVVIIFLIVKSRFEEQLLQEKYSNYGEYRKNTIW
jgi:protein-S-isoprenylcysteine O-methyltransferase Ste14